MPWSHFQYTGKPSRKYPVRPRVTPAEQPPSSLVGLVLWPSAPRPGLPGFPVAQRLHLLVQARFFHQGFDFRAR